MSDDRRFDTHSLSELLAPSLGNEKALEAVELAVVELGLDRHRMSVDQALRALERVAATPGIVGVTARFAKSRLHLAATV